MTNRQLIIGASSFLNAAPLTYGLRHNPEVTVVDDTPSNQAKRLRRGDVDMALIPVVDALFDGDLAVVSGLGVGADGPVRSVKLCCRTPLEKVERVTPDPASHTSNCLARLLFRCHFKQAVTWLNAGNTTANATIVIGDPALRDAGNYVEQFDLADEWKRLTGLPFVFAVWAYRNGTLNPEAAQQLAAESYACGKAHMGEIIDEAATRLQLPALLVSEYVGGAIRYEHGARELEAMQTFVQLLNREQIRPDLQTASETQSTL